MSAIHGKLRMTQLRERPDNGGEGLPADVSDPGHVVPAVEAVGVGDVGDEAVVDLLVRLGRPVTSGSERRRRWRRSRRCGRGACGGGAPG